MGFWKRMGLLWLAMSSVKILLQPSYHSTDLLVHLHWKALTRTISNPAAWYFDDEIVSNRHTLDYPPGFAWFEAFWSRILPPERLAPQIVGRLLVPSDGTLKPDNNDWTKECLKMLPSDDNPTIESQLGTEFSHDAALIEALPACKAYMRTTVLMSDLVLWWGAWMIAVAASPSKPWSVFLSIVMNPALLWLDHVHFQYNGFLLGLWMLSLACLIKGGQCSPSQWTFDAYHLTAAVLFAALLTLKHLYLPLSLWYLVYLFRAYCWDAAYSTHPSRGFFRFPIRWVRFLVLGTATLVTLILPFIPIVRPNDDLYGRKERLVRIFERLFPFARGLVHDYWAGNFWAFYVAADKLLRFLTEYSLPTITPGVAVRVLVFFVMPGAVQGAWHAAGKMVASNATDKIDGSQPNPHSVFWSSLTYTTLAAFATAYHGHEKAILSSLIPLTIGLVDSNPHLVWRMQAFSLLSLLPLLAPPTETVFKLTSMSVYLAVTFHYWILNGQSHTKKWNKILTLVTSLLILATVLMLEGVPISWWGRYEFAPLALTSLVSAAGVSLLGLGQVAFQLKQDIESS